MRVDVVLLPRELIAGQIEGRSVVVLDVLRATTTMAAALAVGVKQIRVFPDPGAAVAAARAFGPSALLCGERDCLPPPGFHLGNSPGAFTREAHAARTLFMTTTNGTRAIMAAQGAAELMVGALVNRAAVARRLAALGRDVTLLCAGTNGAVALEDLIGAGAVLDALQQLVPVTPAGDGPRVAARLYRQARADLPAALRDTTGGRNVIAAGLAEDVEFAARIDVFDAVGAVRHDPLCVVVG